MNLRQQKGGLKIRTKGVFSSCRNFCLKVHESVCCVERLIHGFTLRKWQWSFQIIWQALFNLFGLSAISVLFFYVQNVRHTKVYKRWSFCTFTFQRQLETIRVSWYLHFWNWYFVFLCRFSSDKTDFCHILVGHYGVGPCMLTQWEHFNKISSERGSLRRLFVMDFLFFDIHYQVCFP